MQPLSQQLSELSQQAKKAEERFAKTQSETKDRLEQKRQEAHRDAEVALGRVHEDAERAQQGTKSHLAHIRAKVDADLRHLKEDASARKAKLEAWQAANTAQDRAADARRAISYAVAAIKIAEVATIDAVEARGRAEIKAEQAQPVQA